MYIYLYLFYKTFKINGNYNFVLQLENNIQNNNNNNG